MEHTIKETTRLLLQGTLTKDEADKILLDLYNFSGQSEQLFCGRNIKTCLFYKNKCCKTNEYCKDQVAK